VAQALLTKLLRIHSMELKVSGVHEPHNPAGMPVPENPFNGIERSFSKPAFNTLFSLLRNPFNGIERGSVRPLCL